MPTEYIFSGVFVTSSGNFIILESMYNKIATSHKPTTKNIFCWHLTTTVVYSYWLSSNSSKSNILKINDKIQNMTTKYEKQQTHKSQHLHYTG